MSDNNEGQKGRKPAYLIQDQAGNEVGALWAQTNKETGDPTGRYTGKICQVDVLAQPTKSDAIRFGLSTRRGDQWLDVGVVFPDFGVKFGPNRETQVALKMVPNFQSQT